MEPFSQTLVIDNSWLPRSVISSLRAFTIKYKGNCEIIHEHPEKFKIINPEVEIYKPSVILVNSYINAPYRKVPLTRINVFKRDNFTCVYCGSTKREDLTIDHVIPQSKGGPNTWNNLVTACKSCNSEKSDLTLEEYGKSIPKPSRPHYLMLLKTVSNIPEEWKPFLFLD